jgi:hypothetical protein
VSIIYYSYIFTINRRWVWKYVKRKGNKSFYEHCDEDKNNILVNSRVYNRFLFLVSMKIVVINISNIYVKFAEDFVYL